jgi:glycosyltransferase involved in cell wall biosynthesis
MVLESAPSSRFKPDPRQNGLRQYEPIATLESLDSDRPLELRPLVSIVLPAYNESAILTQNLQEICQYLDRLTDEYRWQVIVVNDGSRDNTGELADAFARTRPEVEVVHHRRNGGLGQALRTGFAQSRGDYIVTLDLDLSYSPDHVERLLDKIRQSGAKIVVASPYMRGGKASNVPWMRLMLSVWANRFLSIAARQSISTLTGMVRVYDAEFLKMLNLRSKGMDINPEVVHKAMLLDAPIEEIPAHLHWLEPALDNAQPKPPRRKSSMRIFRHIWATFYYGFVFRPVMFFIIPSLFFFGLALYSIFWMLIHWWTSYEVLFDSLPTGDRLPSPTHAIAIAFQNNPHTFIIGGMVLMLGIQLFSLGVLAVQNKRYFEEVFYLGTAIYRASSRRS